MTAEHKMRSFVAFIIYAENSVKNYTNGHFVTDDLPAGVEVVNCSTLQVSKKYWYSGVQCLLSHISAAGVKHRTPNAKCQMPNALFACG